MSHVTHEWVMLHMSDDIMRLYLMLHMNVLCHKWMSLVAHEWVIPHMNESCRTWMSHVAHESMRLQGCSCCMWVMSHINHSNQIWMVRWHGWDMSHIDWWHATYGLTALHQIFEIYQWNRLYQWMSFSTSKAQTSKHGLSLKDFVGFLVGHKLYSRPWTCRLRIVWRERERHRETEKESVQRERKKKEQENTSSENWWEGRNHPLSVTVIWHRKWCSWTCRALRVVARLHIVGTHELPEIWSGLENKVWTFLCSTGTENP